MNAATMPRFSHADAASIAFDHGQRGWLLGTRGQGVGRFGVGVASLNQFVAHVADHALHRIVGKPGVADRVRSTRDVDRGLEIDAAKHDAGIDRCRTQRHVNLGAGVQADAGGSDHVFERSLPYHGKTQRYQYLKGRSV